MHPFRHSGERRNPVCRAGFTPQTSREREANGPPRNANHLTARLTCVIPANAGIQ